MKIHLKDDIYIVSDAYDMQIMRIIKCKKQDGDEKGKEYERRIDLSGHCTDFEHLFQSYKKKQILAIDIDGEFDQLVKEVRKIDRDIKELVKIAKMSLEVREDD